MAPRGRLDVMPRRDLKDMSYEFDDHVLEHWDEYCAVELLVAILWTVVPLAAAEQLGRHGEFLMQSCVDAARGEWRCAECGGDRRRYQVINHQVAAEWCLDCDGPYGVKRAP